MRETNLSKKGFGSCNQNTERASVKLASEMSGTRNSNAHRTLSLRVNCFQLGFRYESGTMATELSQQLHRKIWGRFLTGQSQILGSGVLRFFARFPLPTIMPSFMSAFGLHTAQILLLPWSSQGLWRTKLISPFFEFLSYLCSVYI